jgi:hypothetical protein
MSIPFRAHRFQAFRFIKTPEKPLLFPESRIYKNINQFPRQGRPYNAAGKAQPYHRVQHRYHHPCPFL